MTNAIAHRGWRFCGLWLALQAREQNPDRSVALIEVQRVANGARVRPAAMVKKSGTSITL